MLTYRQVESHLRGTSGLSEGLVIVAEMWLCFRSTSSVLTGLRDFKLPPDGVAALSPVLAV